MENWKRAVLATSAGASAIMFLKGKRPETGVLLAGVGLATLASEYPEEFAEFRRNLPDYIERGTNFLDVVARVGERLAKAAARRRSEWYDSLLSD